MVLRKQHQDYFAESLAMIADCIERGYNRNHMCYSILSNFVYFKGNYTTKQILEDTGFSCDQLAGILNNFYAEAASYDFLEEAYNLYLESKFTKSVILLVYAYTLGKPTVFSSCLISFWFVFKN